MVRVVQVRLEWLERVLKIMSNEGIFTCEKDEFVCLFRCSIVVPMPPPRRRRPDDWTTPRSMVLPVPSGTTILSR